MATYKRRSCKELVIEISLDREEEEAGTNVLGPIHDDIVCIIDKCVSY
jgi:hypothetical protein